MRERRSAGPLQYPGAWDMFLLALVAHAVFPGIAHAQEPRGGYAQVGLATFPGAGIQAGYVTAESFFTRELNAVLDVRDFGPEATAQVATTLGGAIRVLGIGRTIGGVRYRGVDLDVGMRVGPALSFRLREDRAFRNRRFNLYLEPFVRWTGLVKRRLLFAELGVHAPVLRFGAWWKIGAGSR